MKMDFYRLMMRTSLLISEVLRMRKAVMHSDGYLKPCVLCGAYIENQMYETISYKRGRTVYMHVTCYTKMKLKNKK